MVGCALLSVKCCWFVQNYRDTYNFELTCLKKEEKGEEETDIGHLVPFWFVTFVMLFMPLGVLLVMKTLEDDCYVVIKDYM